jgi:hypothetical protein
MPRRAVGGGAATRANGHAISDEDGARPVSVSVSVTKTVDLRP